MTQELNLREKTLEFFQVNDNTTNVTNLIKEKTAEIHEDPEMATVLGEVSRLIREVNDNPLDEFRSGLALGYAVGEAIFKNDTDKPKAIVAMDVIQAKPEIIKETLDRYDEEGIVDVFITINDYYFNSLEQLFNCDFATTSFMVGYIMYSYIYRCKMNYLIARG